MSKPRSRTGARGSSSPRASTRACTGNWHTSCSSWVASRRFDNDSGSPPLRMASLMPGVAASAAIAGPQSARAASWSAYGNERRKQYLQCSGHAPLAISSARPAYLRISPPAASPCSRTGSAPKPGTRTSSSARGHTCRSSGSLGSCLRIRATKPRGTSNGKLAPPRSPSAASGSSSKAASSAGSRTASRTAACQLDADRAASSGSAAGCPVVA